MWGGLTRQRQVWRETLQSSSVVNLGYNFARTPPKPPKWLPDMSLVALLLVKCRAVEGASDVVEFVDCEFWL